MARKLEAAIHAGGVVIAPTKITDFAPLYCDEEGKHPVTQFDKSDVEYAGLVKFDFLGLRTLTIINWALEMINKRRAKNGEPPLDIAAIPLDDKKSFDMLQRSETTPVPFSLDVETGAGLVQAPAAVGHLLPVYLIQKTIFYLSPIAVSFIWPATPAEQQ